MEKHRYVAIICIAIVFQLMLIGCQESSQKENDVHLDPTSDEIHRIVINEKTEEIYLLNEYPQKIIKFTYEGEFTVEIQLPIRFMSIALTENGNIALINEANCRKYGNPRGHPNAIFSRLLLITPDGKALEKGGPVNQSYEENILSNTNFGLMKNNKVSYGPLFNDTLFELDDNEPHPSLIVDFGGHTLQTQKIAGLSQE